MVAEGKVQISGLQTVITMHNFWGEIAIMDELRHNNYWVLAQ